MADREQPYDPYIPSGNSAAVAGGANANRDGNHRTAALQAVCQTMRDSLLLFLPFYEMAKAVVEHGNWRS